MRLGASDVLWATRRCLADRHGPLWDSLSAPSRAACYSSARGGRLPECDHWRQRWAGTAPRIGVSPPAAREAGGGIGAHRGAAGRVGRRLRSRRALRRLPRDAGPRAARRGARQYPAQCAPGAAGADRGRRRTGGDHREADRHRRPRLRRAGRVRAQLAAEGGGQPPAPLPRRAPTPAAPGRGRRHRRGALHRCQHRHERRLPGHARPAGGVRVRRWRAPGRGIRAGVRDRRPATVAAQSLRPR